MALFVDGAIASTGNLEFNLSPTAEIDIFVRGDLVLTGRATFGQKERPAASRRQVETSLLLLLKALREHVDIAACCPLPQQPPQPQPAQPLPPPDTKDRSCC